MAEKVFFLVDELRIVGEVYYPRQGKKPYPALCLCHGIPAQPPDPADRGYPSLAERFAAEGFLTLIFNFRGAGESEGNLDILGWTHDLEAAIDYLSRLEEVDKNRLSVMGFSGGAAVAVYVAAKEKRISSLIACACPAEFSAFTKGERLQEFIAQCRRVGTIKEDNFPPSPEQWARNFELVSPINWISHISPRPILILHGENDELVSLAHAQRLYDKAGEPKEMVIIPGGEHRLRTNKLAMDTALNWLKKFSGN